MNKVKIIRVCGVPTQYPFSAELFPGLISVWDKQLSHHWTGTSVAKGLIIQITRRTYQAQARGTGSKINPATDVDSAPMLRRGSYLPPLLESFTISQVSLRVPPVVPEPVEATEIKLSYSADQKLTRGQRR